MSQLISISSLILLMAFAGCMHNEKGDSSEIQKILNSGHRSSENKARDEFRHPAETLTFFDVQPDMRVLEIAPGSGWYTEILAPLLRDKGQLTLAIFDDNSSVDYKKNSNSKLKQKISENSKLYGAPRFVTFDPPEKLGPLGNEGTYDRVLTFRNVHNWMKSEKLEEALAAFHKVLKPGGILGVVEHESLKKGAQDPLAKSGYVQKEYLISLAEKAGFTLVAQSSINSNLKDSTDHPEGVWTLPPSLRMGEKDKEKYISTGESHRMTLKFRK